MSPITLLTGAGDVVASATTNDDGRVPELGPDLLDAGDYRIEFGTGAYFATRGQATFYPRVVIDFTVVAGQAHYHVPLLLSPVRLLDLPRVLTRSPRHPRVPTRTHDSPAQQTRKS